ncbi:CAP domain-containing protein [Blautia massiliensis (ex Durand et al. 2017)]|uniref:CAP domain-containing protein n=1 Tax=Blautia massiliensis (ex Durand et al. 2017) TaxID=1737424 RepID=UPI00073EAEC8|nr:CAP domain-containing protein [Blautia massiliensis (ex Durand et al. 2017)]
MIEKPNKTRLRNGLIAVLLAITLIAPAVFQGPAQAASKRTPTRPVITKVTATKNSATVTWKKSKYATSYRIYYKQAGAKKWTTLATISSKNLKYTHKSSRKHPLKGGKKFTYTVRAYNKYGKKWSSYDKKGKTVTIPAVPSVVKANAKPNGYSQTTVIWSKASNATNYLVYYRSADTTKWTRIANVSAKTLKYVHKSNDRYPVEAGRTYYYMVRGYNKTYKTYGSYNKAGMQVVIPERPVITPTATPTATPRPTQKPKPTATPKPTETPLNTEKFIKEVIRLTNIERQKAGENSVQENAALDKGAAVRAKECAIKYGHHRPNGEICSTAYYESGAGNILGENIAVGFLTPKGVVDGWVNSQGHYVTMIDSRATHMGAGCYKKDGVIYWVQIFAKNPDQKFTLTVDANGGIFPDKGGVEKYTMQIPAGMTLSIDNISKPENNGSRFDKWTVLDETDELEFDVESVIHMFNKLTLKANWAKNLSSN